MLRSILVPVKRALFATAASIALAVSSLFGAASNVVELSLHSLSPAAVRGVRIPIEVQVQIAPGWHIHAHVPSEEFLVPTELSLSAGPGVRTGAIQYPEGQLRSFAFAPHKPLRVYEGRVRFPTWVEVPADYLQAEVRIEAKLNYQACTDTTCAPPTTAVASLLLPVADREEAAPIPQVPQGSGFTDFAARLERSGFLVTFALVVLLGLGLNFTPCVYPLISVTVAYFGRQARQDFRRLVLLAVLYFAGIVVSFGSLGAAAALSGGLFGAWLQKPAVLVATAALMAFLALGSFGLYQIRVPARWLQVAGGASPGALGALLMGLTMGIVAAPCIGPVIAGLVLFVGSRGDLWLGLGLFCALGMGLGLPYLVLALAAGSLRVLPRSGDWLVWVEHLFGVVLLVLAWYFLAPLLPAGVRRFGYVLLLLGAAFGLGFLDRAGQSLPSFRVFKRIFGITVAAVALWLAFPQRSHSSIGWVPFSQESLAQAAQQRRPVVLDFVADWCIPCHEMDVSTFADPRVVELARDFLMLRADLTLENEYTQGVTKQFDVRGVPTLIVLDENGREVARLVGYVSADELLEAMHRARPHESQPR